MHHEKTPPPRGRQGRLMATLGLLAMLIMALLCAAIPLLQAQEPGDVPTVSSPSPRPVVELKDDEVTAERLIEILAPPGGTRGLNVVPRTPHCAVYRRRLTRGVAVRGITAAAAIRIDFGFNSADIAPQAAQKLEAMGQALGSERLASSCIRVEGHTDGIGSNAFNDRLSRRRAEAVVHYLATRFGLDPQRLVGVGRGKREPIDDNGTPEGRQRNRRVEIANLGSGDES